MIGLPARTESRTGCPNRQKSDGSARRLPRSARMLADASTLQANRIQPFCRGVGVAPLFVLRGTARDVAAVWDRDCRAAPGAPHLPRASTPSHRRPAGLPAGPVTWHGRVCAFAGAVALASAMALAGAAFFSNSSIPATCANAATFSRSARASARWNAHIPKRWNFGGAAAKKAVVRAIASSMTAGIDRAQYYGKKVAFRTPPPPRPLPDPRGSPPRPRAAPHLCHRPMEPQN